MSTLPVFLTRACTCFSLSLLFPTAALTSVIFFAELSHAGRGYKTPPRQSLFSRVTRSLCDAIVSDPGRVRWQIDQARRQGVNRPGPLDGITTSLADAIQGKTPERIQWERDQDRLHGVVRKSPIEKLALTVEDAIAGKTPEELLRERNRERADRQADDRYDRRRAEERRNSSSTAYDTPPSSASLSAPAIVTEANPQNVSRNSFVPYPPDQELTENGVRAIFIRWPSEYRKNKYYDEGIVARLNHYFDLSNGRSESPHVTLVGNEKAYYSGNSKYLLVINSWSEEAVGYAIYIVPSVPVDPGKMHSEQSGWSMELAQYLAQLRNNPER